MEYGLRLNATDRPTADGRKRTRTHPTNQNKTHHSSKGCVLLLLVPSRCSACSKRYWLYHRSVGSRMTVAKTASC